jgi:hypothetical protein
VVAAVAREPGPAADAGYLLPVRERRCEPDLVEELVLGGLAGLFESGTPRPVRRGRGVSAGAGSTAGPRGADADEDYEAAAAMRVNQRLGQVDTR